MFRRAQRLLKGFKPLLAASLLSFTYTFQKVSFDEPRPNFEELNVEKDPHRLLKQIIEKDICDSK